MKVTFPNGFGESYTYDMFGRRMTKSQFNHTGSIQETMKYHYKGDTYVITDEKNSAGETAASYTFSESGRPLSRVYNRYGERVREGIGWMGDLNTGNGSPGSRQGPEDESGNTAPDYHPGIGNAPAASSAAASETDTTAGTADTTAAETEDALAWLEETDAAVQETADITTELVKYNPYRYAGYYWDRKTQLYFLQARYYDPRNGRFLSAASYRGEVEQPLSLNLYIYSLNNPVNYVDPTGHMSWWQVDDLAKGIISSLGSIKDLFSWSTLDTLWETIKAVYKGKISLRDIARQAAGSVLQPFNYLIRNIEMHLMKPSS